MSKLMLNIPIWVMSLLLTTTYAYARNTQAHWQSAELAPLVDFFVNENMPKSTWPALFFIEKSQLTVPYDYLLTQPLMTVGIAQYYQRTPQVRKPLYRIENSNQQIYSRGIIMIIDNDQHRDQALVADHLGQSTVVELGLITINFKALPPTVIDGILHTPTPFGALLVKNHIKTHDAQTHYFMIKCNQHFSQYWQCPAGKILYGRTNTLVRDDNSQWVAHVVEILTGVKHS
jgi:hypothetical protein